MKKERDPSLDVLRGIAVALVIFRHLDVDALAPGALKTVFSVLHHIGWVGVDLFFVLSGYLVSGLLEHEWAATGHVRALRFLGRRAFKIYPAFYVLLAVTCLARTRLGAGLDIRAAVSEALFVQNYGPSLWNHTWSLAVEEHFYLVLAGLFALAPAVGRATNVRRFAACAVAICLLMRYVGTAPIPFRTDQRLDALALGWLLRMANLPRPRRAVLFGAALLLSAPAMVLGQEDRFTSTLGLLFLDLGCACVLWAVVRTASEPGVLARGVARFGRDSHSVYLWHMPVIAWTPRLLEKLHVSVPASLVACAEIALSAVVGVVAARTIEWPVLALRERVLPSRTSAVAVEPAQ